MPIRGKPSVSVAVLTTLSVSVTAETVTQIKSMFVIARVNSYGRTPTADVGSTASRNLLRQPPDKTVKVSSRTTQCVIYTTRRTPQQGDVGKRFVVL